MIKFTNISGSDEIGSNCYLLELDGTRVVLDSGMHPKKEGLAAMPNFDAIEENSLDAIFLSHSHLDHLGTIPVLQDKQPTAEVFMTPATAALSEVMLHNSVNVMMSKRLELGIVEYPFFTHKELDVLCESWRAKTCNEAFRVGYRQNILATFYDAGHILGSAGIQLETESGHTVFYTGDVQFEDQSMIPGADFPESGIDTLIMECTRGGAHRCEHYTRSSEMERFGHQIAKTLERGGAVLIPVFAIGKSQEMLYNLHQFKQNGVIPGNTPVYFGGLSAKVTTLYDKFSTLTRRHDPDFKLKEEVETVPLPRKGRAPLVCSPGNIYVVSSGMMTEKTISNSIADQFLPYPSHSIFFVGYCDPDSPAGILKDTPHGDNVKMRPNGQKVPRLCEIQSFDFSGHAPRESLVAYAKKLSPKRIILVHGDPDAIEWMQNRLQEELPDTEVVAPEQGVCYSFES